MSQPLQSLQSKIAVQDYKEAAQCWKQWEKGLSY